MHRALEETKINKRGMLAPPGPALAALQLEPRALLRC